MNACGAALEIAYGRPILSWLHAGYSIAGLAGAGIGGLSAEPGVGPLPTFAASAVALITRRRVRGPADGHRRPPPETGERPDNAPGRSPGTERTAR